MLVDGVLHGLQYDQRF